MNSNMILATARGGQGGMGIQVIILIVFIAAMYFLLIRPQKKKEKKVKEMRDSIRVGDEIVTIGGICGKVVKTKDESIVVQVGTDKVKFEMMRWSVSSIVNRSKKSESTRESGTDEVAETTPRRTGPKRLKKKSPSKDKSSETDADKSSDTSVSKAEDSSEPKSGNGNDPDASQDMDEAASAKAENK